MPIASAIEIAAQEYERNNALLKKGIAGLTDEEWLRQPNESSNHLLWIVCHVIWARGALLGLLGSPWTRPWFPLFARGVKRDTAAAYPTPEEVTLALQEVSASLTAAMEAASDETLAKPSPERIPSADGKLSGVVNFLAHHETYHIGQVAYLRCWLGHEGVAG
jgi:hypothetical protein